MEKELNFDTMSAEELAKYHQDFIEQKNAELNEKVEAKADASQIKELKDEMFNSIQELTKQLNIALENQYKAMKDRSPMHKSLAGNIEDMIAGVKDDLFAIGSGQKSGSVISGIKTAVAMTFATSTTSTDAPVVVPAIIDGVNQIRKRNPFMIQIVNVDTTDSNLVYWVEEEAQVGDAGTTAEGVSKSKVQYKVVGKNSTMGKETIILTISKEMLKYPKFMSNFIRTSMLRDLSLRIDSVVTTAIIAKATAFDAGTLASTVVNANLYDVIAASVLQAEIEHFMPNVVALHPTDLTKLKLVKDKNEQYLIAPFANAEGTIIDGLRVVSNTGITAGKALVFGSELVNVWFGENITFEMGLNNDDFEKNMKSMLAEAEFLTVIQGNNAKGIIYADIATAITALSKS